MIEHRGDFAVHDGPFDTIEAIRQAHRDRPRGLRRVAWAVLGLLGLHRAPPRFEIGVQRDPNGTWVVVHDTR